MKICNSESSLTGCTMATEKSRCTRRLNYRATSSNSTQFESVSVGSSDHSEFKAVLAPRCRSSFLLRRFSPFLATLSVSPFPPSSYHHPDLPCCICLSNVNNDDHRSRSVRRRPRLHLDRNFVSRSGRTHPQHFGRMVCTCFFFAQSRPCSIA